MTTKFEGRAVNGVFMADDRRGGEPPTYDEVRAYMEGRLPEEEAEKIRERLVEHPELVRALTAEFPSEPAQPGDADYVSDEEYPEHWARLERRMNGEPARKVVSFWPYLSVAAAIAAIVFGSLLAQARIQLAEERMPKAAVPSNILLPDGQRGPTEKPAIVDLDGDSILLVLAIVGSSEPVDAYRLEMVRTAEPQKVLWSTRMRATPDADTFTISVPRSFLEAGKYEVRLSSIRGSHQESVATYTFQVPPARPE